MRQLPAVLAAAAVALQGCADPSEIQALRAKQASLQGERATLQQVLAHQALYRGALEQVPLAGKPLSVSEVTARVTKATSGVAVSVERAANGGLEVSFSGPAGAGRAAVALQQLAGYLPDLSLRSVSVKEDGFSARGSVEPPAARAVPAVNGGRKLIPLSEARQLREEVEALERAVQAARAKVDPDVAERGPAALEAVQSPDRFRQQAAVVQALVGGATPIAASADLDFELNVIRTRGALAPGRQVMDALPRFKADYDVLSMSANAGRFELKLAPRATER